MFQPTNPVAADTFLHTYLVPLLTAFVAVVGAYFALKYANRENKKDIARLSIEIQRVDANLTKHVDSPDHPTASEIRHVMNILADIQKKDVIDHQRIEGKVDRIYDHLIEKNHG
jgi:hypothetical protein